MRGNNHTRVAQEPRRRRAEIGYNGHMTIFLFKTAANKTALTIALWLTLAIALPLLLAACAGARADVPALERRAQGLNKTIMCPVCPGESIDQSQNALAAQMRGIVDEKLAAGWTDDEVRDFFVERYGPSVLLEPPTQGIALAAWIGAPAAVAIALIAFALALRHMRRKPPDSDEYAATDVAADDDDAAADPALRPYYDRIEAALSDDADAPKAKERGDS